MYITTYMINHLRLCILFELEQFFPQWIKIRFYYE